MNIVVVVMEIKWTPSSTRLVLGSQKLDDRRGCMYRLYPGKSNLLSSLALKVGEQVRLCKLEGGGELPQQFSVKPGRAVKKKEREKERGRKKESVTGR